MKKLLLLSPVHAFLLIAACCTGAAAAPPAASPTPAPVRTVATNGEPSALQLENGGRLTFCDKRGGRQLDLASGRETALNRACPSPAEPNTACADLNLDVEVQSSLSQPNDVLDIEGRKVRMKGRVHDCAADGKVLAVATTSSVVVIDTERGTTKEIGRQGGDRVTIGFGWVAWSKGAQLGMAAR